jgi:hypothetical protein
MSDWEHCLICGWSGRPDEDDPRGLKLFDEGYFHVTDPEIQGKYGHPRNCWERYERVVAELRPRYGYNAGTENWTQFLEEHPDYNPITGNVGNGWIGIVVNLTEALLLDNPDLMVVQMKEKFGGLRYYTNGISDLGNTLVGWAESRSYRVCEYCGERGQERGGGWIKTLCDDCHVMREAAREAVRE